MSYLRLISTKSLLVRNKYLWASLFWTILITVSCLLSAETVNKVSWINIPNKDKIAHFIFYFIFTLLWYKHFRVLNKSRAKARVRVFLFAIVWGLLLEVLQGLFTTQRSAELFDMVANALGSATAVLLLWLYYIYRR